MKRAFLALIMGLFLCATADAAPIVLSGSWGAGTAFWNNASYDRNGQANIGNWITKSGASDVPNFYANSPSIGATWLGNGTATFLFDFSDPASMTHWFSVTGWNDEFGVYDPQTGQRTALGLAWDQQYAATGRTTPSFTPGIYGIYMRSGEGNYWYSGQLGPDGRSHFALFQGGTPYNWYLGIEDATFNTPRTADWDYNDVILEMQTQPVPEPGSMSMIALGLGSLFVARRKWKQ